ncbi:MAG: LytR family transcriptional regulator [Marmoricola sp.]|nr:LytR family transcriptional regulator [Marmoricola sp.]
MVSGVTLVVLLVVLGGMAVYGFKAATAPLPESGSASPARCDSKSTSVRKTIGRSDVQVSVFNAGTKAGLASSALDNLEAAGFRGGNTGNAPEDAVVRRAVVWTTKADDTAARLVALSLGRGTRVEVVTDDLGPGIDVLVGNRFDASSSGGGSLNPSAPRRLKLPKPVETCVNVGG